MAPRQGDNPRDVKARPKEAGQQSRQADAQQRGPVDDPEEQLQGSRIHHLNSPDPELGNAPTSLGSGYSSLEQQLLLQMEACVQDNPRFSRDIQEEMLHAASREHAWHFALPSVQQLGQALRPSSRAAEAEAGPKLSWLARQQQRRKHMRSGVDDSYDPEGDESYSDDYASVLKTAMALWEEEGRGYGRRLSRHAFKGRLALGSSSWSRRLIPFGKEGRRLPGVPAGWLDSTDDCCVSGAAAIGPVAPSPSSLQWRLPWAEAPAP